MSVGIGKRSVRKDRREIPKENIRTDLNPLPFDWSEHGPRLRSKRQTTCGDQSVQHVLFVLDTSGSIGTTQFTRMKNALSKLPGLFCKQVKFAVITFSTFVHREFCFNCFENTLFGRSGVSNAIKNITYRHSQMHL